MSDTSSSTSTDTKSPDEVVFSTKINGQEREVTRAQAIRYAQQVGSMAEQAAALSKRQEDLDAYDRLAAGMERDPNGTLAALASAAGGSFTPRGATNTAQDLDDEDEDPTIAELKSKIAALESQVGGAFGEVHGVKAEIAVEKEINALRTKYPKMSDDDFRETIQKVSIYNGLPLQEAYRLVQMEKIENGRTSEAPDEDRTKLPIVPGSGTPASRIGNDKDKLDYSKDLKAVLADSWALTAEKLGISPDL